MEILLAQEPLGAGVSLDWSAERKEGHALAWLTRVEGALGKGLREGQSIKPHEAALEKVLLQLVTSTSPPRPTRPLRQLIGRCYTLMYSYPDAKTLFDTLTSIQGILAGGSSKSRSATPLESANRLCAIHVLGRVCEQHASRLLSLFPETINLLSKGINNKDPTTKYESIIAMSRTYTGAGKAATEAMVKESVKLGKSGLNDKSVAIQCASAKLFESIYLHSIHALPSSLYEYDSAISGYLKYFDSQNSDFRRSISSMLAALICRSQTIIPAPLQSSSKKNQEANALQEQSILSVEEMIHGLFVQNIGAKPTSKAEKIGLIEAFSDCLNRMGLKFMEAHYALLLKGCIDMATHPKIMAAKQFPLLRELVNFLLHESIGSRLSEAGQIAAVSELINNWIRKFVPVSPGDLVPSDGAFVVALDELACLFRDLGPAAGGIQDSLAEPLFSLLNHSSNLVCVAVAWTLRCLCLALPSHLPRLMAKCIGFLQREASSLQGDRGELLDKFLAHAGALSLLVRVVPERRLYISFEQPSNVFSLAVQLLKSATSAKDLRANLTQVTVAWQLLASLMTLGPDFVSVHMSQLLLVWKNSFPKPNSKDVSGLNGESGWVYSFTTKEMALAALHSFLVHNQDELVTLDVAKRIIVCLNNAMSLLTMLPASYMPTPFNETGSQSAFRILTAESGFKAQIFTCFRSLSSPPGPAFLFESSHTTLLKLAEACFAPGIENSPGASVGAGSDRLAMLIGDKGQSYIPDPSLLSRSHLGTYTSSIGQEGSEVRGIGQALESRSDMARVEALSEAVVMKSFQSTLIVTPRNHQSQEHPLQRYPVFTEAVDAAIDLFAYLLPLQSMGLQETYLERFRRFFTAPLAKNEREKSARRKSIELNLLIAALGGLRYALKLKNGASVASGSSIAAIGFVPSVSPVVMRDMLAYYVTSPDACSRVLACEALGILCQLQSSASFINPLIQVYVDKVVQMRDPLSRVGSALALGSIHSHLGALAASQQMKTTVNILHSLAADPHPLVHTWALHSLWIMIESTGLMFNPFINSTLVLIARLYMSEHFEPTAVSVIATASQDDFETNRYVYPALGRILHALVGVLGPELMFSEDTRNSCFSLYEDLKQDSDPFVVMEAIRCVQHFILFAASQVDVPSLIPFLQSQVTGADASHLYFKRKASLTCLFQLSMRYADSILEAASNLEEMLLGLLDTETEVVVRDEIKDTLKHLLTHVIQTRPSRWLDLAKVILSKTGSMMASVDDGRKSGGAVANASDLVLDEGAGGEGTTSPQLSPQPSGAPTSQVILLPRWRTRLFVLVCVRQMLHQLTDKVHFDLIAARQAEHIGDFLVFRLTDLIRLAFLASTTAVDEVRMEGLGLLQDIIQKFASAMDPDHESHPLLEQYQAQIGAALTPAFSPEVSVEVTSKACAVSAVYLSAGICQDMNRVIKLLSGLLQTCHQKHEGSVPNSFIMLKLSALRAWADICIASNSSTSGNSAVMESIVPNLTVLANSWISAVQEYAKHILDEEEDSMHVEDLSLRSGLDTYANATREVVMPFFKKSWLSLIRALTLLIQSRNPVVVSFFATRSRASNSVLIQSGGLDIMSDQCASDEYLAMLGICVETLSATSGSVGLEGIPGLTSGGNVQAATQALKQRENTRRLVACLECLCQLLNPQFLSPQQLADSIFAELFLIFDRVMQTEDVPIQSLVVKVCFNLLEQYGKSFLLRDQVACFSIAKLAANVLAYHIPLLCNNPTAKVTAYRPLATETVVLVGDALSLVAKLSASLSSDPEASITMQEDCISIFCSFISFILVILNDDRLAEDLTPKCLLLLKQVLDANASLPEIRLTTIIHPAITSLVTLIEAESVGNFSSVFAKHAVMALMLFQSILPPGSNAYPAAREKSFRYLLRYLAMNEKMSLTCIRSLTLPQLGSSRPEVESFGITNARIFLPHILQSIDNPFTSLEFSQDCMLFISQLFGVLPNKHQLLLRLVIPFYSSIIVTRKPSASLATSYLVCFAEQYGPDFKLILTSMDEETRRVLEGAFRSAAQAREEQLREVERRSAAAFSSPKIQLKSFI